MRDRSEMLVVPSQSVLVLRGEGRAGTSSGRGTSSGVLRSPLFLSPGSGSFSTLPVTKHNQSACRARQTRHLPPVFLHNTSCTRETCCYLLYSKTSELAPKVSHLPAQETSGVTSEEALSVIPASNHTRPPRPRPAVTAVISPAGGH